jgi:hypothetical protein
MPSDCLQFRDSGKRWWQKPLVVVQGTVVPAELAVLRSELDQGEEGLWLNSRGLTTGVTDLVVDTRMRTGYRTVRVTLPSEVSDILRHLYQSSGLVKGCPDLVIWKGLKVRLVEVKCPHWDKPSAEQQQFLAVATAAGLPSKIVEWELI